MHTGDQLAALFCEIAFCAALSALSKMPPCLRPPSSRPGRHTQSDIRLQVAGLPVYAGVKRYTDPWLWEQGLPSDRDELQPSDLYRRLQEGKVPEQFPEHTVNLVFVFHRSFNKKDTLEQALFGWGAVRLRPLCLPAEHQQVDGLFARENWQDISGCCLCRVSGVKRQVLHIWENPWAAVPIPSRVHSALRRAAM